MPEDKKEDKKDSDKKDTPQLAYGLFGLCNEYVPFLTPVNCS